MRVAFMFDIHGNLPALEAALAAVQGDAPDYVYHGGDLIGWGPQPNEVVDLIVAERIPGVVGNHELLVLSRFTEENRLRNQSTRWTADRVSRESDRVLAELPPTLLTDKFLLAHANPAAWRSPADVECFPYVRGTEDLMRLPPGFAWAPGGLIVTGHVHLPAVYVAHLGGTALEMREMQATEPALEVALGPDEQAFIVAGAVGKPRDGVPAANYVLLDADTRIISLRRVPYDVDAVCSLIRRSDLPDVLADDLAQGR